MAIAGTTERIKSTGTIQSVMQYSSPPTDGTKPVQYAMAPPPGVPVANFGNVPYTTTFHDIKSVPNYFSEFNLDVSGFQIVENTDASADLLAAIARKEDERIEKEYYPQVEKILLDHAEGAKKILVFDHTVRIMPNKEDKDAPESAQNRGPAKRAHVDQSQWAGYERVRRHVSKELGEKLLQGRVRIINVWRPLRGPVMDVSLAFGDYRSVDHEKDLHETNLIFPDRQGEILLLSPNPAHKWYYVHEQQPHEVALIKCFDTREGVAKLTPHGAFDLPNVPENALPRQSIEVRALVFDLDGTE